ncbi:hypothetical protein [Qipengyuania pacifica]|uniref:hypothetical protein n=1 Tax=Qipengyuania pacifica TaxID=2860199 RepID=UPI001C9DE658|nr:hypothetical protein [Qipengyuania pacifica]MBY8332387.1 hypothetical protein [Qipengyuania pacifica]
MALSLVNSEASSNRPVSLDWPAIQFAQFEHDEKYHPEISRLPVQDRLRHMTLHFAKYAGRLSEGPTDADFERLATDALIIGISCANTLNIDLSKVGDAISPDQRDEFARQMTVYAGRMASACERLDHLEDFPFRPTLAEQVLKVISASLGVFFSNGWSPVEKMRERLAAVKAKKLFHGKL